MFVIYFIARNAKYTIISLQTIFINILNLSQIFFFIKIIEALKIIAMKNRKIYGLTKTKWLFETYKVPQKFFSVIIAEHRK